MNVNRISLKIFVLALAIAALFAGPAHANNLTITNVTLGNNTGSTIDISFNITWNNSWYDTGAPSPSANWDAAWVFIKYSTSTSSGSSWSPWYHAALNGSGDTLSTGEQEAYGVTNGVNKGVFLYNSSPTGGAVTNNWNTTLRWNYAANGVSSSAAMDVQVFGIEMVYVSTGAYTLGSGASDEIDPFYTYPTLTSPYQVTSETGSITVGAVSGDLYYNNTNGNGGTQTGTISATFPKGYHAFYLMKYDVSQRQYCDFLNTLTTQQSANRVSNEFNSYRNWIKLASNGKYGTDAGNVAGSWGSANYALMNSSTGGGWTAANYMEWADVVAYADWAALRPLTELEYEKAARGPQPPVADGFAWGSTSITPGSGLSSQYTSSEGPSNGGANPGGANINDSSSGYGGPIRSGAFAGSNTTSQVLSGAGYYGAMDLSGNLWKETVTVGNTQGLAFDGQPGDGNLDVNGNVPTTGVTVNWPNYSSAAGSGVRGGGWYFSSAYARVSDRYYAVLAVTGRGNGVGCRCARTSP